MLAKNLTYNVNLISWINIPVDCRTSCHIKSFEIVLAGVAVK